MVHFGAVLKEIRLSKNLRLKELACAQMSESTISRFENGVSKLSIDHFHLLLERLGVSLTELDQLLHCYYSQEKCLFTRLDHAIESGELEALQNLLTDICTSTETERSLCNQHIRWILEQHINRLAHLPYHSQKCQKIIHYLLNVDTWLEYEVQLFYHSVFFMKAKDIQLLYRAAFKTTRYLLKTGDRAHTAFSLYLSNLQLLLENSLIEQAAFFIDDIKQVLPKHGFYFEKVYLHFLEGVYLIKSTHGKEGENYCLEALEIIRKYDDPTFTSRLKERFQLQHIL